MGEVELLLINLKKNWPDDAVLELSGQNIRKEKRYYPSFLLMISMMIRSADLNSSIRASY